MANQRQLKLLPLVTTLSGPPGVLRLNLESPEELDSLPLASMCRGFSALYSRRFLCLLRAISRRTRVTYALMCLPATIHPEGCQIASAGLSLDASAGLSPDALNISFRRR